MNCERIQELILTDYLDDTLIESAQKQVEEHLIRCPQCLEFSRTAKRTAFEPFDRLEKVQPPDHLWSRIEHAILDEKINNESPSWFEQLRLVFSNPRPVIAFVAVFVLFAALGTIRQFNVQKVAENRHSIEYLALVMGTINETSTSDSSDFGTDVEQYFL